MLNLSVYYKAVCLKQTRRRAVQVTIISFDPIFMYFLRVALLLILSSGLAWAQTPQRLSLREAVNLALSNSTNLQKAENGLLSQKLGVEQFQAAFLPSVNLSAGLDQNFGLNFNFATGALDFSPTTSANVVLNGSLPLYARGYWHVPYLYKSNTPVQIQQLEKSREAGKQNLARAKENIIFTVVTAYLDFIRNQEQVKVLEENLAAQKQQLERVRQFVRGGARASADEYQQQALVAQAELQVLSAQRLIELSKTRLIQLLQLDPLKNYEFTVPKVNENMLTKDTYDVNGMVRRAMEGRTDVLAQKTTIEATRLGIEAAKLGTKPQLSLGSSVSTRYASSSKENPLDPNSARKNIFSQLWENRNLGLGLNFSMPIYDRGETRREVQRAQLDYENAVLDLKSLEQTVAVEVRQAYLDYINADKQFEVSNIQLTFRKQALDAEQNRYNLGASTLTELTQARAGYFEAQNQRLQALYALIFQKQVLEYYVGRINPNTSVLGQ